MQFKRTQIYLEPDQHRALLEEARDRGVSLAALLREIVSTWTSGPPSPAGFDALIGVVDEAGQTPRRSRTKR